VSDLHIRLLRSIARRAQGELDDYDAVDHDASSASRDRRRHLNLVAVRTRVSVAAAEARRRVSPRAR
jgi:hypothetical protein